MTSQKTLDKPNRSLTLKVIIIWGVASVLFFISLADMPWTNSVAQHLSEYLPVVKGQLEKNTQIGFVAGRFFALAALVIPGAVLFLLWGDDILQRARVGMARSEGKWKYFFTVYLLLVPFCIFILGVVFFAPIEVPQDPRLMGQIVIHSMVNTYRGLFLFGAIGVVGVVLFVWMLFCFLSLPILFIYKRAD